MPRVIVHRTAQSCADAYFIVRAVLYLDSKRVMDDTPMRFLGLVLRTLFLIVVVAVTARVATPQNESLWTAYDTPADLFRIILGATVCIFVAFQIFRYSRNPADMRNWVPIGLAVVPLAVICAVVIW
ncbi:hypothetical protein [Bradyrhizobium sp. LTSP885]|uniref:hypothetical protein n=1 Tax=Bradyrhizobium sp. LTSP885 TaxID=1619232 RepID=UPI0012E004D8|nr:hypothetical protein [Bradyrhizobium sp. LTSP885]